MSYVWDFAISQWLIKTMSHKETSLELLGQKFAVNKTY